jgi:hypothetical protein
MSQEKLEINEFNYTTWLSEKYEMEKKYAKRMEESSLLAHKHIGMLQAMLSIASLKCTDYEKAKINEVLSEMEKERSEFALNTKF